MTTTAVEQRQRRQQESPWEAEQRRRRERVNQRKRRALKAGKRPNLGSARRSYAQDPITPTVTFAAAAACRDADPGLFFGPDGETASERRRRVAKARAICLTCPIRARCLEAARDNREAYGVWGGVDLEAERKAARSA